MFSQSWELVKRSFDVLKKDKEMLLFPMMSAAATMASLALFMLPALTLRSHEGIAMSFFIFYFGSYFIAVFFNTGLVICADIRLKGGDPTVRDGISGAAKHFGNIFLWALIAGTVGVLISSLTSNRKSLFSRIAGSILGFSWGLVSFFVIPVMVFENVGPFEALKRSTSLIQKTWGENIAGQFSTGAVFFVLGVVGAVPLVLVLYTQSMGLFAVIGAATLVYWALLAIISSSLNGIFTVSLYEYAMGNQRAPMADLAKNAFVKMG